MAALLILLGHGLPQILLQLLIQLFRHKGTDICTTQRHKNLRLLPSDELVAVVDSVSDEIYSRQTLNALLAIHVMDSSSNNRGADDTGAKAEEVGVFLFSIPVAENAQWRSSRSGGLSFYGNKPAGKPL